MPSVKSNIVDADITRLFAKHAQCSSPNDLDLRIVGAAAQAVDSGQKDEAKSKKRRSPILFITIVALVLAILYPVVRSFNNLPNTVQDSSRILSK